MENWIKHELYHLNNKILWWHDVTHDNMSSHDIRDLTSRNDFISTKLDIWLLLYVAASELERWFCLCFARYLGQEVHSNYRRLRDLHSWPWNWRSRHGLRDFRYLCLYLSYRNDFCCCFVRFLGRGIHSITIATCVTLTYDLETQGHVMVYVTFLRHVDHDVTLSFQGHSWRLTQTAIVGMNSVT